MHGCISLSQSGAQLGWQETFRARKVFLATGLSRPGPALRRCPAAGERLPLAQARLQSVSGSRWLQALRSECQSPLLEQLLQSLFQLPVRPLKAFHHLHCPLKVFLDSLF